MPPHGAYCRPNSSGVACQETAAASQCLDKLVAAIPLASQRFVVKSVRVDDIRKTQSRSGGMADALDSKSSTRKGVWVQVPPPVLSCF